MEYEKVIFLDIDGVLATEECYMNTEFKFGKHIYKWNSECVKVLNEVLSETDAVIVLSSDWRTFFDLQTLDEIFKWNNVIKSPIDVTDDQRYTFGRRLELDRIHQIGRFLKDNQIKNWVAIDDLNLKSDIVENFVRVEETEGISAQGVKENLISILNSN